MTPDVIEKNDGVMTILPSPLMMLPLENNWRADKLSNTDLLFGETWFHFIYKKYANIEINNFIRMLQIFA